MKVWVYPEKTWEELGAERWEVEWQVLTKAAKARRAADPNYEHDHDVDEVSVCRAFKTKPAAMKFAQKVLDEVQTVYGCVAIRRQVVDWYVEEDRIAEWATVDGEDEWLP